MINQKYMPKFLNLCKKLKEISEYALIYQDNSKNEGYQIKFEKKQNEDRGIVFQTQDKQYTDVIGMDDDDELICWVIQKIEEHLREKQV